MISDEKVGHIVHLMLEGLKKEGLVRFTKPEEAIREGKRVCLQFVSSLTACSEKAKARIASLKNPPPPSSQQWANLYQKYYEEELRRSGG